MTLRSAYGPKKRQQISFPEQGRTKISMQAECDINNIMKKYQKTGVIDFVNTHQSQYGDATGLDFQQAMERVAKSREMFADLPSSVRKRFENDPGQFLDFINDANNDKEARQMGLIRDRRASKNPVDPKTAARRDGDPRATAAKRAPEEPKKATGTAEK